MASDLLSDDQVLKRNYTSKAFSLRQWIAKAKELEQAARIIEPKVLQYWEDCEIASQTKPHRFPPDTFTGVYFMLLSFSIENYLKGSILITKACELKATFLENNQFPKVLKGHNLVLLSKKAEFKFTRDEENLLRRLTRSAVWYGRYPVPLDYRSLHSSIYSDGKRYLDSWFSSTDSTKLNALIRKIELFIAETQNCLSSHLNI